MASELDKMIAGQPYDAFVPELIAARVRAKSLCKWLEDLGEDDQLLRQLIYKDLFKSVGEGVLLQPPIQCDHPEAKLLIGN